MNYEKYDITLMGTNWSLYIPVNKTTPGQLPSNKGHVYLEKINTEYRKRYWVSNFVPTMQGTISITILKDLEDLTVPTLEYSGKFHKKFIVREELTQMLYNLPTGATPKVEHNGKFLCRALCETVIGSNKEHDVVPFVFDVDTLSFTAVQPLVFTTNVTDSDLTITVQDTAGSPMFSIDNQNSWSADLTYSLSSGEHTIYAKDQSNNIVTAKVTI